MPLLARAWIGAGRAQRRSGRSEPAVDPLTLLRSEARGRTGLDVGCISVTGVDLMPASSRFTTKHDRRGSTVRFVHSDIHDPDVVDEVGPHDVVCCARGMLRGGGVRAGGAAARAVPGHGDRSAGMRRVALLAALAALALPAAAAQAAIPGENGPIAYVTSRMGPPIPMVIDPDGGTPRSVGRPGQVGPAWSPDGSALAVAGAASGGPRAATTFEIFTMPLGGEPVAITADRGQDFDPAWSPDGRRIAYSATTGDNRDIWTVDATGGNAQRLTTDSADDALPAWSPDGSQIAFTRTRRNDGVISLMGTDGSNQRDLRRSTGDDEDPEWSPDGTRIAFTHYKRNSSTADIWTMSAIGTGARPLVRTRANETQPSWSPDGTDLAYTSNRRHHDDIWVVPVAGGRATNVTPDSASDDSPAWGPRSAVGNLEAVPGLQRAPQPRRPGFSL